MIKVIAFTLALGLTGCGWAAEIGAHVGGYTRSCVNGVSYLQFPSGVTVEWTFENKVRLCGNEK